MLFLNTIANLLKYFEKHVCKYSENVQVFTLQDCECLIKICLVKQVTFIEYTNNLKKYEKPNTYIQTPGLKQDVTVSSVSSDDPCHAFVHTPLQCDLHLSNHASVFLYNFSSYICTSTQCIAFFSFVQTVM